MYICFVKSLFFLFFLNVEFCFHHRGNIKFFFLGAAYQPSRQNVPSTLWRRNLKTEVSPWLTHQIFSVHTTSEEFKKATITGHFGFVFEESRSRKGKSHDYREVLVIEKLRFQNAFRPQENNKPTFSNSSCLKRIFEKLRFRDGLVWTVGLAVEIKLRFQFSLA